MLKCHFCSAKKLYKSYLNFYRCNNCGLYARYPMPTDRELNVIYQDHYKKSNIKDKKTQMVSSANELLSKFFFQKFLNVSKNIKYLDFGSSTGDLFTCLQKLDIDSNILFYGVENNDNARTASSKKFKSVRFYKDIPKMKFDFISMIEVIEHLKNPWDTLKNLNNSLSTDGLLFITTPNRKGLNSLITREKWREINFPTHLIMFDQKFLKKLLNDAGFKKVTFLRFYPVHYKSVIDLLKIKALQLLGLHGGICVIAKK